MGAPLTVIYSAEYAAPKTTKTRPAAILPLLIILFVVSYCILTFLVFEQGQTIESQRGLIREMLKDSTQLAALKGKMARDDGKRPHDKASSTVAAEPDASNTMRSDIPSKSAAQGAKGSDKDPKRPGKAARTMKEIPGKPAADLEDVRRFTRVI